ncbi:helix-turn-helix domain-containing protein [Amycolatopsis sp. lyj-112]|uniref:AlbA family DNA-binding domain-containing protein n=1 Tax=Amycolatopsis sp. lyj-112 TaxID=2789288 RepID=UPI00397A5F73
MESRVAGQTVPMMPSTSFYLGPSRPRVHLGTWRELCAAADAGLLQEENQWLECKRDIPRGSDKSRELAKDLASLSVDGGVIVVGAVDKIGDATGLVGVATPEKLSDRISQVATAGISPPLNVVIDVVRDEQDPAGPVCLLVVVPASAGAPHMVDEKYWGRSATDKRVLADHEVRRLLAERTSRVADFEQQLRAMKHDFEPFGEHARNFGHIYLFAKPVMAPSVQVTQVLAPQHPANWIGEFLPGKPEFYPGFTMLGHGVPHAEGLMVTASRPDAPSGGEPGLLQLLLDDQGGIRVTSGSGTRKNGGERCISPNYHLELAHQLVSVSAGILNHYAASRGLWDIGVHATDLRGLKSTFAMNEEHYRYSTWPFQTTDYTCTISASTDEMLDATAAVVERLYGRFARGLGLDTVLFPYDTFAQIGQRVPQGHQ